MIKNTFNLKIYYVTIIYSAIIDKGMIIMFNYDIENLIESLNKRNMNGYFVKDRAELLEFLSILVDENTSTGSGDSLSLCQLEVFNFLRENTIFNDKFKENLSIEEKRKIALNNFNVDVFFSSCNAISQDGELVFIDASGKRVAPIIYGPKQVIIIVGTNKITPDLESAMYRARQIAAPKDSRRLDKKTPCKVTGKCSHCMAKDRLCNSFVTISHQIDDNRIHVIIVDKELGF